MIEIGLMFSHKDIADKSFESYLTTCKARFFKRMGSTANVLYVREGEKPYSHIGLVVRESTLSSGHFVLARED